MKERPILFSGEMVRAILNGRKTMTRRVVKSGTFDDTECTKACPYGQIGDRLWVRETWAQDDYDKHAPVYFRADFSKYSDAQIKELAPDGGWRPSIYIPRWASRITLEITGVKVQRLQEISEEDAVSEGVKKSIGGKWCGKPHEAHGAPRQRNTAVEAFADLWDSINAKRGYGWEANPWV